MDTYWIPSSGVIETVNQPAPNATKSDVNGTGTNLNSTMASFANIFAGATAAIASSANVNSEMLNNGKNFMGSGTVPSLNQIDISSANQLSKRSGVFPIACTLPGMATISNIGLANGNMIISGTPTQITGDLQQITSGQLAFASTPQMTVTISKDFIQQAAAESGVSVGRSNSLVQQRMYSEQGITSTSVAAPADLAVTFAPDNSEKIYKCPECDETFKQAGALTYHTFVAHAQLQSRPHKCPICPESFLHAHHLDDHTKAVHSVVPTHCFTCSECQMSFNNGGSLNYHIYMAHTVSGTRTLQHTCSHCGKSFIKASLLSAHVKNVHGVHSVHSSHLVNPSRNMDNSAEKQYTCSSCDKVFKLPFHLKQHIISAHEKPHKCDICGKSFGRRSDLNRHTRGVHMRERPHSCPKCGWTFAEAGNLKHHMLAVHSNKKNYRCTICSRGFSISSYLKTHMARVHGVVDTGKTTASTVNNQQTVISTTKTDLTQLQVVTPQSQVSRCFECGQIFANATMLQNHVMSTHAQPFWCTVCGEGFSHSYQLQNHLQLRHSDNNNNNNVSVVVPGQNNQVPPSNPVSVNTINPTATLMNQLNAAVGVNNAGCSIILTKDHDNVCPTFNKDVALAAISIAGERPYLCSKCGKGFKTATHLKQHVRCVHAKERPHKCERCQKTFARMSDLNRHVKGVHDKLKTTARALRLTNSKCSECGASFSETSQLKRHFLTVHLNQRPSYKCADCQEGFPDEARFKNHICHEQDRPYSCSICSKRFSEMAQVRRHMRSSHSQFASQLRHKCNKCGRAFSRPVDLDRHVHAVHLKEKPHKCVYCNKFFGLHGNLNKHIRAVHMLEKPHQCVECGKCFAHIGVLKRHLRDIHFYDRRPLHNNALSKDDKKLLLPTPAIAEGQSRAGATDLGSQPVPSEDPTEQLSVIQAFEALHEEQQLAQTNIPSQNIELITRNHPPTMVQTTPQIQTEPVPPNQI